MPEQRLRYEFSHLGQTDSAGFTSTYPGLLQNGTNGDGAPWYEMTEFVEEPDNVVFSFGKTTEDVENQLDSTGIEKGVSSKLIVFAEGNNYVRHWLIDHPNGSINSLAVRITDMVCTPVKSMGIWEIKADNLQWCDGECSIALNLTEYTPMGNCLKNALIADNHRNWFPDDGVVKGKDDGITGDPLPDYLHPTFPYCIDIKPQALQNFMFVLAQTLSFAFGLIIAVVGAILDIIDWIVDQLGGTFTGDDNFDDSMNELLEDIFERLIGCNRKHPAPFIRTYFENGCSKCGIEFESNVFKDPVGEHKDWYNAALLFAPGRIGYTDNEIEDDFKDWIPTNAPQETVVSFAYVLKNIFNLKFKLQDGVFSLHTKNTFPTTTVFDFTGPDKDLLLEPLCYGWNANKKPASITMEFAQDVKDIAGDEALHRVNGAKDWATNNPFYEGIVAIKSDMVSAARWTTDGIDKKLAFTKLDNQDFWTDGIMLIEKGYTQLYKILIWDGESDINNAVVVRKHVSTQYTLQWQDEWIYAASPGEDYWVYNYPMMFDWQTNEGYNEFGPFPPELVHKNLFELHKIDDPTQSSLQNKSWRATLELCCSTLNMLIDDDTAGDGIMCHLDYLVQLKSNEKGVITQVEVDYEKNEIRLAGEIKYTV